jgi:Mn-dependent DtxR family transcriptional regulator
MNNWRKILTFNGKKPIVNLVETIYQTGVTLTKQEMAKVEEQIERHTELSKWFVSITGNPS